MPASAYQVGQLIAQLGLDNSQFMAGMASAQAQMKMADAAMKKASLSMQASLTAVGNKMIAVGRMANRFLTLPILAAGVASFKAQKDFEFSMSKIQGLVGESADEVKRLTDEVLKLSPEVGRGPEELADALFFIESAGVKGAYAMETLERSAKASVVGLGEVATVADLTTSAMNAYGKENLSAAMATDILVAAVREGKAPADEMAGAIGAVIPLASEMGVSFDQVGAAFAGMTRTGTNALKAATQVKALLSSLKKPTDDAKIALNEMGLSAQGLRDKVRKDGLISTLELLRTTTDKYGEEMVARVFPNIRALIGILDLMGANMEDNIAISERMANSMGSLDRAVEAASQTTQVKWDKAVAQVKTTLVKLGMAMKDLIIPIIENITERIRNFTDRLDGMSDAQKQSALKTAALVAAMGPLLSIAGRLLKFIVANPYLAMAVAIAGIVLATVKWIKTNRELFDGLSGIEHANRQVNREYDNQATKVQALVRMIENENLSNETRQGYIEKLKEIMPDYNATLTDEGELIGHNKEAIDSYLESLREKIRLQVYEEEYEELLRKQLNLQTKIARATAETTFMGAAGLFGEANLARLNKQYDNIVRDIEEMEKAAASLNLTLGQTPTPTPTTPTGGSGGKGSGSGGSGLPELAAIEKWTQEAGDYWDIYYDLLEENQKTSAEMFDQVQQELTDSFIRETERRMKAEDEAIKTQTAKLQAYAGIAHDLAASIGGIIGGQEGAFKSLVSTMLSGIDKVIQALLAQAIAGFVANKVAIPGGLIAAAIGVPILLGLWNSLVPSFAAGGLVYGETIGRIGEYPGAASDPEVIAPLSKLKRELFGGSGAPKVIELTLSGRTAKALISLEDLLEMTY